MELLTVFWVDAAGSWTLWKYLPPKWESHTSLSTFSKVGCYSLSHPWAMQESQMGSNLHNFICWLSHTSNYAISSQNYISFSKLSHNHTNQNPGPFDLYLCHCKLWQSPKVTEGMVRVVESCWWLLLLVATCGTEGHAGDSASVLQAHSIPRSHCLSEDSTWAKPNPGSGHFLYLLHEYHVIFLVFLSALSQIISHSSLSVPLLAHGMNEWHISSWKHGYLRGAWRKKITQIIGTTGPQ